MQRLPEFAFVLIVLFAGCRQPGSLQENFSFNPQPGIVYKISVRKINDQQWIYRDKPGHFTDTSQDEYNFQLLRKTDTAFLLKLQFENFIRQGGNRKINTNTKNVSLAETQYNYNALNDYLLHFAKGKYVTVWMNKKGRPIQVNGFERLVDSVTVASGISESITRLYLRNFISDEIIKDELNKLFCFLPDKPKAPGQSWVENIVLIEKAPVKWSCIFEIKHRSEDTVVVRCSSLVSARQGDSGRTYMKGKLAGYIVAGYSTGIPYKWTAEMETVTETDNYDITNKQTITASITPVKK